MQRMTALFCGTVLLVQAGAAFAEADPADRITTSSGRENPVLAAVCRERLGLDPEEIPPNGAPLANFRRCMVDEQMKIDRLQLVAEQQARSARRLKEKQTRRMVRTDAATVQRSIRENVLRRQVFIRGRVTASGSLRIKQLRHERTNRRLQLRQREAQSGSLTIRNSLRIHCVGVLANERRDCIQQQIEIFNQLQGK